MKLHIYVESFMYRTYRVHCVYTQLYSSNLALILLCTTRQYPVCICAHLKHMYVVYYLHTTYPYSHFSKYENDQGTIFESTIVSPIPALALFLF